jgi:hypothetical protein
MPPATGSGVAASRCCAMTTLSGHGHSRGSKPLPANGAVCFTRLLHSPLMAELSHRDEATDVGGGRGARDTSREGVPCSGRLPCLMKRMQTSPITILGPGDLSERLPDPWR